MRRRARSSAFTAVAPVNLWDDASASGVGWSFSSPTWTNTLAGGTRSCSYTHAGLTDEAIIRITGDATGLAASSTNLRFSAGSAALQGSVTTDGEFSVDITVDGSNESIGFAGVMGGAGTKEVSNLVYFYL